MQPQSLRDALTGRNVPIEEADRAWDASCLQNVQSTRTDIDDINDLIDGAVALSAKVRSLVEAIIEYGKGEACGAGNNLDQFGILKRLGDRSRYARGEVASAEEELERLARSFGL